MEEDQIRKKYNDIVLGFIQKNNKDKDLSPDVDIEFCAQLLALQTF